MEKYWANKQNANQEAPVPAGVGDIQFKSEAIREVGFWTSTVFSLLTVLNVLGGDAGTARFGLLLFWLSAHALGEALRRAGRLGQSAAVLGCGGMALACAGEWFSGGLSSAAVGESVLVVIVAGLIGGSGLAWGLAAMASANVGIMWLAQSMGVTAPNLVGTSNLSQAVHQVALVALAGFSVNISLVRVTKSNLAECEHQAKAMEAVESFKALFVKSPAPMGLTEANVRQGQSVRLAVAVNEAFEKMFEADAASAIKIPGAQMTLWRELGQLMQVRDMLSENGHVEAFKAKMKTWSGNRHLVCLVSAVPMVWDAMPSVLWTFQDITETERLREEMEGLNVELEASVRVKVQELGLARKELERREHLANLGEMIAGVAHEVNTPIGNALLALSTLAEPARKLEEMSSGQSLSRSELSKASKKVKEASDMAMENLVRASEVIKNFKQLSTDQVGPASKALF